MAARRATCWDHSRRKDLFKQENCYCALLDYLYQCWDNGAWPSALQRMAKANTCVLLPDTMWLQGKYVPWSPLKWHPVCLPTSFGECSNSGNLEDLKRLLGERFPNATITLDLPNDPKLGSTWLNVTIRSTIFVVEYRDSWRFGVSRLTGDEGFGEPPEEWVATAEQAFNWIQERAWAPPRFKIGDTVRFHMSVPQGLGLSPSPRGRSFRITSVGTDHGGRGQHRYWGLADEAPLKRGAPMGAYEEELEPESVQLQG